MADLLVIVPSRGRPANVRRLVEAFGATDAWTDADLLVVFDADDPQRDGYARLRDGAPPGLLMRQAARRRAMVPQMERAARRHHRRYFALASFGDDHVPQTAGWVRAYLDALRDMGTGIVFGDDLDRGPELPTQWAQTSDIVATLGRMVPAPVRHQFCDRSILDLGRVADCIRYLPDVVVEHRHYSVGKAPKDDGYASANAKARYAADQRAYQRWRVHRLPSDAARVRALREGRP